MKIIAVVKQRVKLTVDRDYFWRVFTCGHVVPEPLTQPIDQASAHAYVCHACAMRVRKARGRDEAR